MQKAQVKLNYRGNLSQHKQFVCFCLKGKEISVKDASLPFQSNYLGKKKSIINTSTSKYLLIQQITWCFKRITILMCGPTSLSHNKNHFWLHKPGPLSGKEKNDIIISKNKENMLFQATTKRQPGQGNMCNLTKDRTIRTTSKQLKPSCLL